ncbi:MAG: hypothetical protein M1837_002119 [Sclerophora amabilis]|nr:MAG: hypothetical protein M1837_002119 [Sclerophora amabilis]
MKTTTEAMEPSRSLPVAASDFDGNAAAGARRVVERDGRGQRAQLGGGGRDGTVGPKGLGQLPLHVIAAATGKVPFILGAELGGRVGGGRASSVGRIIVVVVAAVTIWLGPVAGAANAKEMHVGPLRLLLGLDLGAQACGLIGQGEEGGLAHLVAVAGASNAGRKGTVTVQEGRSRELDHQRRLVAALVVVPGAANADSDVLLVVLVVLVVLVDTRVGERGHRSPRTLVWSRLEEDQEAGSGADLCGGRG